ncbi:activated RNA polymerase II transcriptional coactivator p15-like [Lissotriton helveticus]
MSKSKGKVQSSESSESSEEKDLQKRKREEPKGKKEAKSVPTDNGDSNEKMFQIGKLRYVRVSAFKKKTLIDIREFYVDKNCDTKPGRKGISLFPEQWQSLKEQIPNIDAAIRKF